MTKRFSYHGLGGAIFIFRLRKAGHMGSVE